MLGVWGSPYLPKRHRSLDLSIGKASKEATDPVKANVGKAVEKPYTFRDI